MDVTLKGDISHHPETISDVDGVIYYTTDREDLKINTTSIAEFNNLFDFHIVPYQDGTIIIGEGQESKDLIKQLKEEDMKRMAAQIEAMSNTRREGMEFILQAIEKMDYPSAASNNSLKRKKHTMIRQGTFSHTPETIEQNRNALCKCGSGKKVKKCCKK